MKTSYFLIACLFAVSFASAAPYLMVDNGAYNNNGGATSVDANNARGSAASFNATATVTLSYIKATLVRSGTPTGNIVIDIYDNNVTNGSIPVLTATGTSDGINRAAIAATYTNYTFNFTNVTLTAGNQYWISLRNSTNTSSAANFIQWNLGTNTNSNLWRYSTTGVWTSWAASFQGNYEVWVENITTPGTDSLTITAYDANNPTSQLTDFYANISYNGFTENNLHTTNSTIYLHPLVDQSGNNNSFALGAGANYNSSTKSYTTNGSASIVSSSLPLSDLTNFTENTDFSIMINYNCAETSCGANTSHGTGFFAKNFDMGFHFSAGTNTTNTRNVFGVRNATYASDAGIMNDNFEDKTGWYNYIITYVASTMNMSMYKNCALVDTGIVTARNWSVSGSQWLLYSSAATVSGNNNAFNGSNSDIKMWSDDLTSSEIVTACANGSVTDGLVAWYPFVNVTQNGSLISANVSNPTHFQNQSQIVNTSTSPYATYLVPWANVSCFDRYDGSAILACTAEVAGVNYTTTTGSVLVQSPANTTTYDAILYSSNYFSTEVLNIPGYPTYNATLFQAQVNFQAFEIISGDNITTFTVTSALQNNTNTSPILYMLGGSYSTTFNKTGWYNSTESFTVAALSNTTQNFTVYDTILNISAINNITGTAITTFNLTLNSTTYNYSVSIGTTNGTVYVPWIDNDSITIDFSSGGFAVTNHNISVNASGIQNYTLNVYTERSILFTVYDEQNQTLINWTNVTVQLSGTTDSRNFTFSNGSYYIDLLAPQEYLITYFADEYPIRTYYYTVTANSTAGIELYLLLRSNATATVHTVRDVTNSRVIPDAYIYLQRKNLTGTNSYTVEICKTDGNGQCVLQVELIDAIYRVLIVYGDEVVYNSGDTEFSSTTKTWSINLQSRVLQDFFAVQGFNFNFTYTNTSNTTGYFSYSYLDTNNLVSSTCLEIRSRNYTEETVLDLTCTSGTSGTINTSITLGGQETCGYTYLVVSSGETYGVKRVCVVNTTAPSYFGGAGIFYIVLPTFLVCLFLFKYSPSISIVVGMFVMFTTWMLGFLPTTVAALSLVIGIGAIIVMSRLES